MNKSSIKSKLCKYCTNFEKKGLTNGPKHDIIKISKVSLVSFNTQRSFIYDLRILQSQYEASEDNATGY